MQSWLLAPFGWLFGVTGVLVGVALLNAAAVAGALVVARRRGGVTLTVLVASVLLVLTLANGTDLFINPWNPWVAVLPFFTYLLLAWSLADGDVVVLPWLVGVGTYIVQAHVSYAPLVLGAGLVAALMAWRAPRSAHGGGVRMPVLIALGTGVVLWLPPLVQQLFSDDGNLAAIIEFFRDPPEAQAGWRLAWGIMGTELGPPGAWLTGDELGAFGVLPSGTVPLRAAHRRHGGGGPRRLPPRIAERRPVGPAGRRRLRPRCHRHLANHRLDRHVPRAVVVGAGGGRLVVARLVGDVPASGSASPAGRARRRGGGDGGAVRVGDGARRAGWPPRR